MIKFINTTCDEHKPYTAVESIEMNISDEASLPDILEAFEGFLKASSYHIPENGYIDIVQDDKNDVEYNIDTINLTGSYSSDLESTITGPDGTPIFKIVE